MWKVWKRVEPILTTAEHADFVFGWVRSLVGSLFGLGIGSLMYSLLQRIVELSGHMAMGAWLICVGVALIVVFKTLAVMNKRGVTAGMILYIVVPVILAILFCVWVCAIGLKVYRLSSSVRHLEIQMMRYVLPRSLSDEQKQKISDELSKTPPQPIVIRILKNDQEASSYAGSIRQAIEKGGWVVTKMESVDDIQQGLSLNISSPMTPPVFDKYGRQILPAKPDDALAEALKKADVVITQRGGGSGQAITETTITLSIGGRPRDKWAVRPKDFGDRMFSNRPPNYPSDDDF